MKKEHEKKSNSTRSKRSTSMLYQSTYFGSEDDSDKDDFHITKPFKHNERVHHEILHSAEFESDESYEMESEEEDKLIAGQIRGQNQILHSIQKTITKLSNAIEFNRKM